MRNTILQNVKGRDKLEDLNIDGKVIPKLVCEVVDWINLTQDRDKWLALVKKVMNIQVP
jgi:hypothetical protein